MNLQFNKQKPLELNKAYSKNGYAHISDFFKENQIKSLQSQLAGLDEWQRVLSQGGTHYALLPDERRVMTTKHIKSLEQIAFNEAGKGYHTYLHDHVCLEEARTDNSAPRFLRGISESFNEYDFLEFARTVTGDTKINKVRVRLSRFGPGDFVTANNGNPKGSKRRAAFMVSLNVKWHSDWGGQLQFFGDDGHVQSGMTPKFNHMCIFKVPLDHAISQVSLFAQEKSYKIFGWLLEE